MQIIEEMTIKTNKGISERSEVFQKVENAMFCVSCGKQYLDSEVQRNENKCTVCNGMEFLKGDFAATLAGYIQLDKLGKLKDYYKMRTRKTSGARMNTKRTIIWLLVKDGFIVPGDKKVEDVIYRCLWKKW